MNPQIIHLDNRLAYVPFYCQPGWEEHVRSVVGFLPNELSPQQEVDCFKNFSPGKINIGNWKSNWKRFSIRSLKHGLRKELQFAGIYVIQKRASRYNKVLYIGSSMNLSKRLTIRHEKISHLLNSPGVVICIRKTKKRNEHLSLEASLIERLLPEMNKNYLIKKERTPCEE